METREAVANDLLRAAARLSRWASRLASFDVPFAQARLLALLDELGPARVSVLAEADHCSQPTMTTALQRLESAGWAQRVPDPSDARASLLSLTPAGRDTLEAIRDARAAVLSPTLAGLDEDEVERLRDAAAVVEGLLQRVAPPSQAPTPQTTPQTTPSTPTRKDV
ncbi:MarR family winged helix-turn-helix transcriptional regulator [Pedococcus ginsenosidimutans]|uniref:MarR family winged helix-turn-helix transcriptional regulator n=1 Tax=Pedococcus ginsenosidimutans TaxID=490570 RepID=A0ABP8YL08_9MICO